MKRTPTLAVLLAAGRGRRLGAHTAYIPKPLLPVAGRPTLDYVLAAAAQAQLQTVILVTHHLGEQIEDFVGDGSAWGVSAVTCRQPHLSGTAHALQTAVAAYPHLFARERPFLLTATDYVLPATYLHALVRAHMNDGTDITLSLKRLPPEEMRRSSAIRQQPDGHITEIIEKPPPGIEAGSLASSLTFVLPGSTLDFLPTMTRSPRGEFEIQDVINRMLQAGQTARGLVLATPHEWCEADGVHAGDVS